MKRRPSIRDIAETTGVSAATVSLALRDKGRMADSTRNRIKQAAAEAGYVPNSTARSLAGGRTQLIAIALPSIENSPHELGSVEYFFRLLGAATAKALQMDHGLLVVSPSEDPDRFAVDGAVVVDPGDDDRTIAAFDRLDLPVVTIGRRLGDAESRPHRSLIVNNDFISATEDVLDHLRERGSSSIALFACRPIDSFQKDSISSYRAWCDRQGVTPRVVMADSSMPEQASRAAKEIFGGPERIDGVYATVDTLAESVLEIAARRGCAVPHDLRIATCSDGVISRSTSPALTTLDEKAVELGEAAVEMLITAILDPGAGPSFVQVSTELLIRESTA
ncbi:MAG: LacI family DNA-binding transcriptional regulator [Solirubrobacterales bacterium]